jgi:2-oxo-3-hexenedioate decarboxylase
LPLAPQLLARELAAAYATRRPIAVPPSGRDQGFDLAAAYEVEAELARLRRAGGARTLGRKVGFANRALWRKFGLDTVLWAHMYSDTVHYASGGSASLSVGGMVSPKIEPEIIFKLKHGPRGDPTDPEAVLDAVEWLALGFEIVDCLYQDWKFQPPDFVAAFGLHAGLVVGEPRRVEPGMIPALSGLLSAAPAVLLRDGQIIAEGSAANVLQSPALCLGELAAGIARQPGAEPLAPGEIIATGAMTDNQFIAAGESWAASIHGLELPDLTLRLTA